MRGSFRIHAPFQGSGSFGRIGTDGTLRAEIEATRGARGNTWGNGFGSGIPDSLPASALPASSSSARDAPSAKAFHAAAFGEFDDTAAR